MLPKISQPLFECTLPATKKVIKYRPMQVREEKILLIAKQSADRTDIYNGITQIVGNCVADDKFKANQLPLCDLEYLYIQIRSNSVGNIVKVSYIDSEDEQQYDFEVDLTKIGVTEVTVPNKFELPDNVNLLLKYPPSSIYMDSEFASLPDADAFDKIFLSTLDKIYQGDKVFSCADSTKEELKEFIDSIPSKSYNDIRKFLTSLPVLKYQIEYKNSKGTDRKINLTTLEDFFIFA